ncbi:MAG: carbon-nitrogen hydrolase family protein [Betaproteobacteria bacterium]|nr:carbon-nitrogen hydrolase family protein [Betaproteobacteria bacterium]
MAIVAAVQMVSGPEVQKNLWDMGQWVRQAALKGAQLVVLPEYFCLMAPNPQEKCLHAESACDLGAVPTEPIQSALSAAAKSNRVWLVGGTVPLRSSDPGRVFNACLVFDPEGRLAARYDKLHLFSFQQGQEAFDEAKTICPGDRPAACETPVGHTALSVCYDIRFPEYFRTLATPAPLDLIVVSAAFTETTGRAHWETLLRARAIENQTWLIASAQGGEHPGGRRTWGHSMLIDPWGRIISERATGAGLVVGEVDASVTEQIRINLPALRHRTIGVSL